MVSLVKSPKYKGVVEETSKCKALEDEANELKSLALRRKFQKPYVQRDVKV